MLGKALKRRFKAAGFKGVLRRRQGLWNRRIYALSSLGHENPKLGGHPFLFFSMPTETKNIITLFCMIPSSFYKIYQLGLHCSCNMLDHPALMVQIYLCHPTMLGLSCLCVASRVGMSIMILVCFSMVVTCLFFQLWYN